MPVNLSIKNVPDSVAELLRARAERNHRSLQGELMAILEQATQSRTPNEDAPVVAAKRLSIEEVVDRARKLFPDGTPSSTTYIRAMRDGRYGKKWARTGRQDEPE